MKESGKKKNPPTYCINNYHNVVTEDLFVIERCRVQSSTPIMPISSVRLKLETFLILWEVFGLPLPVVWYVSWWKWCWIGDSWTGVTPSPFYSTVSRDGMFISGRTGGFLVKSLTSCLSAVEDLILCLSNHNEMRQVNHIVMFSPSHKLSVS